jgi:hypothetical protein
VTNENAIIGQPDQKYWIVINLSHFQGLVRNSHENAVRVAQEYAAKNGTSMGVFKLVGVASPVTPLAEYIEVGDEQT